MQTAIEFENSGKVTWGELKRLIEKRGVSDNDEIDRIDIAWGCAEEIIIIHDDDYGWQIYL